MAPPSPPSTDGPRLLVRDGKEPVAAGYTREQYIVEAWGQGFNFGALIVLILFVLCNYRRGILLHKLILLELLLASGHGLFVFFNDPTFGWVLSATATLLYASYTLHNVIAWLKIKPFLPRWGGRIFIISILAVQPYWVLEMYANFQYFNNLHHGSIFEMSRYFEPLARDPWWIFTTIKLVLVINESYEYTIPTLIKTSPRFGIMLLCMVLSIIFLILDVIATAVISTQSGINPYWRLALVFKCASDAIFLDDFKSVLDRIAESALRRVTNTYASRGGISSSRHRQPSVNPAPTAEGASVSISAKNRDSMVNGEGKKKKKKWGVSRLTSSARRDSSEQRILGGDTGPDGQPRIMKETTFTVSEDIGPGGHGSQASSEDMGDPIMSMQDVRLGVPATYDWANGRPRASGSGTRGVDDLEQGIPMQSWDGKQVGFG